MSKYSVPETLAVSDSGFLFLPNTGETFTLNLVGKEILNLLQDGLSEEEIVKHMLDRYDIDERSLEKDLSDFIMQLRKYSIIKEE
ncbi:MULTISPECIES: PqqD family protein [Ignavibacterium]|jgi:hypothetical protein|uniref:PqqD family protein n=1 Tax=Ignavibacterium TaxID=795750 RepID=UPI0025C4A96E|nr:MULTISPECIES: PqqD family protein [Ignavibacterium]MBI5660840.1 PqqD family protein [Ignavibacterium album]